MNAAGAALSRQPAGIASRPTAKANTRRIIFPDTVAGCMLTAMPDSKTCIAMAPSAMVACMAHVRRKFVDVHKAQGSAIVDEAIRRIAELYAVEKVARGLPPDKRAEIRQAEARPAFDDLEAWLNTQLPNISGKSPLASAIRYGLSRMARIDAFIEQGGKDLSWGLIDKARHAQMGKHLNPFTFQLGPH